MLTVYCPSPQGSYGYGGLGVDNLNECWSSNNGDEDDECTGIRDFCGVCVSCTQPECGYNAYLGCDGCCFNPENSNKLRVMFCQMWCV